MLYVGFCYVSLWMPCLRAVAIDLGLFHHGQSCGVLFVLHVGRKSIVNGYINSPVVFVGMLFLT